MSEPSTVKKQYSTVLLPPVRRNAQDGGCSDKTQTSGAQKADPSDPAPLIDLLSSRSSVSPTITITKTLFSAGLVTSTRNGIPTSGRLIDLTSGLPAGPSSSQGVTGTTITDTSTLFRTNTVTSSTRRSTPLINLNILSKTQSAANSSSTTLSSSNTTQSQADRSNTAGTAAGVTVGVFSTMGLIGFLIWYFCLGRGQNGSGFNLTLNFNRKKNEMRTPQMEDQKMQEARNVMLAEAIRKSQARNRPECGNDHQHSTAIPSTSTETDARSSVIIGMAVTNDALPATATLSAESREPVIIGGDSAIPAVLRPTMMPAPIYTSLPPQIGDPEHVSPLSPRGMYNAAAAGAGKAWKRASQVLSPGPYANVQPAGPSGFEFLGNDGKLKGSYAGVSREPSRATPGAPAGLWI